MGDELPKSLKTKFDIIIGLKPAVVDATNEAGLTVNKMLLTAAGVGLATVLAFSFQPNIPPEFRSTAIDVARPLAYTLLLAGASLVTTTFSGSAILTLILWLEALVKSDGEANPEAESKIHQMQARAGVMVFLSRATSLASYLCFLWAITIVILALPSIAAYGASAPP